MSKATQKAYIFIFMCFSTKGFHIEIGSALTTCAGIAGRRRFVSLRGLHSTIYSDNGTNFIGARNEVTALQDLLSTGSHSSLTLYAQAVVSNVSQYHRGHHILTVSGKLQLRVKSCEDDL